MPKYGTVPNHRIITLAVGCYVVVGDMHSIESPSIWVILYPRVLFYFLFWFLEKVHLRSVDFRSMHPKCVLLVSAFLWGHFASGSNLPNFSPRNHFYFYCPRKSDLCCFLYLIYRRYTFAIFFAQFFERTC